MKTMQTVAACVFAAGLAFGAGCSHDTSMDPPGPGPTALPQSTGGSGGTPGIGGINTESRMGSDHPMQPASTQP